jgi:hypothetical protein
MSGIDGVSGLGGGVSVIKVRSSQSQPTREAPTLVSRFQGQKVVDRLTSNLDFSVVDDRASAESLLERYSQPFSTSFVSKTPASFDLQSVLNPFANLPQSQPSSQLANLKEAKFDLSTGLDRFSAEQVVALLQEDTPVADLQKSLGVSLDEIIQAQDALRSIGFDNENQLFPMNKDFFAAGKPLKPDQSKSDGFEALLSANRYNISPADLLALQESVNHAQMSLSDRAWERLSTGEQPIYRFSPKDLESVHDRPMMIAPYGITPARQKNGEIIYRAPLLGNQNAQGQLSPERMTALAIYAAWRWLSTWSKERFGEQSVDLYNMEIEVIPIAEIDSDFSAVAQQPSMQRVEEMLRHMRNFGKDTLKMDIFIYDSNGRLVAIVRTKYGVFATNKRSRRVLRAASLT